MKTKPDLRSKFQKSDFVPSTRTHQRALIGCKDSAVTEVRRQRRGGVAPARRPSHCSVSSLQETLFINTTCVQKYVDKYLNTLPLPVTPLLF